MKNNQHLTVKTDPIYNKNHRDGQKSSHRQNRSNIWWKSQKRTKIITPSEQVKYMMKITETDKNRYL